MSRTPDPSKRARILELSIESFCEKGFKDTSIKDIADRAQVAPGTVYTYFKDKRELYYAAINEIWSRFFQELDSILSRGTELTMALLEAHEMASRLLMMSHILVNDMFTNRVRRNILKANLLRTAQILSQHFCQATSETPFPRANPQLLTVQIELILYGAFFQLAICEKEDFVNIRQSQQQAIRAFLTGESG